MIRFHENQWALILGGSSGFGLAAAKKLAAEGMSVCVVHRDRRGSMDKVEREFETIRQIGHGFISLNLDALSPDGMRTVCETLGPKLGEAGRIRVLLHSIAFGNLKPIAPTRPSSTSTAETLSRLAGLLGVDTQKLSGSVKELFDQGNASLYSLIPGPGEEQPEQSGVLSFLEEEDMARTIHSMGTSLLSWVQLIHHKGFFTQDARVIGLTSEGNEIAWKGYAAVSAAKCALEAVSRAIAMEFGAFGIRSNIVQAGITDTPALRLIPGSERMKAAALLRNPLRRLTTPEDVADAISLLCTDEARWINGALIRVDGGEHIGSA